ncbi:hypothetical protein ACN47A_04655 [Myxococcus fulvus]|uniref:hypothetical protein n=1 Tax=Myxococcus fulvus TaxID=33 RepID=UPI003B9D4CF4
MAERARGQVPGGWLRSVARRVKDWARAVLSEEEADFAAALSQARLMPERARPATSGPPITVPRGPPLPPASIMMVTAPAVGVGPPEHWLRDVQARRAMGPPADWVARVRKVAPHLVEGMTDEVSSPPLSDAHLSARARMMLSGSATDPGSRRPLPPPAMAPSVRARPSPPRLSRRVESRAASENPAPRWREGGTSPSPGSSSSASASEVATPGGAGTSGSWAHPFASPPCAPIPSEPAPLPVEGPTTPVPLMLRGAPFPNPVRVESTPVSPSEVCVPPLGELDNDDGLSSSGLPQGISASQASGVQHPVAAPRPRSTAELWIPRRPGADAAPVHAEPVPREQYVASGPRTAPGRTETWPGEHGQGAPRQAAHPVEEEAGQSSSSRDTDDEDVARELRLWERMRRLEREH